MSDASADRDPFEVVAESFLARFRAGERPSIDEFATRYPELAEQIRELIPALVQVEQDLSFDTGAPPAPHSTPTPSTARQFGDYRILREIGRGGMGVVYEAEQVSLGRRVALKILPHNIADDGRSLDRFRREAKAAGRLHHTNIVPIFEVGRDRNVAFYAMQLIHGQGLDQVIRELRRLRPFGRTSAGKDSGGSMAEAGSNRPLGPVAESLVTGHFGTEPWRPDRGDAPEAIAAGKPAPFDVAATIDAGAQSSGDFQLHNPPPEPESAPAMMPGGTAVSMVQSSRRRQPFFRSVAQIGLQAAQGLAHAHARGVVHRDVKPSNLLLDTTGVVWITDFGLAKAEEDGLTATGDILGTIRYMAPERFRGEGDGRVDIYALGLTLYELLTLRPAFNLSDRITLMEQIKTHDPPPPRSLDGRIPRDLETIILKAIDKDPNRRYATMDVLVEDLRRFLADEPIKARPTSTAERYLRWARRNPSIAALCAIVTGMLLLATVISLVVAGRFAQLADRAQHAADSDRAARNEASRKSTAALAARAEADAARNAAQAETYRAVLNEARSLRTAHLPGWRVDALRALGRLLTMPTPHRDLSDLRTEATAALGTPDVRPELQIEVPGGSLGSIAFSRDGQTLVTALRNTGLDFWDLTRHAHRFSVPNVNVEVNGQNRIVYLVDEHAYAIGTRDSGVIFIDEHGARTGRAPIVQGSSAPTKLMISADGRRIAVSWTSDGGTTVHDAATGAEVDRFAGNNFALSPDGERIVIQEGGEIAVRPVASTESRIVLAQRGGTEAFAFSPDGSMIAGAFPDHTAVLWNVETREVFCTLRGHHEKVLGLAFSPDGAWIATSSLDYTTRIWETRTGQHVTTLSGIVPAFRLQWSPSGDRLAVCAAAVSGAVMLYATTGRDEVRKPLIGHHRELRSVAAHPRREQIVTSGYSEVRSWDLSVPRPTSVALEPNQGGVLSMAFSPDGSALGIASWHGRTANEVAIREPSAGKIQSRFSWRGYIEALAFDRTAERLAFGDSAGTAVVWDIAANQLEQQFATGAAIKAVAFLDAPRRLVTHGANSVLIFNLERPGLERQVEFAGDRVQTLAVDRSRNRVLVGFASGAIASLSLPDLKPGPRFEHAHDGTVSLLGLSPDGCLLATGGADRRVVLHDAASLEKLLGFPSWAGNLRDLTFDRTGRQLAIVGTDCDVELWDLDALNDGLTSLGLAWDEPAPGVAPTANRMHTDGYIQPAFEVIRRP